MRLKEGQDQAWGNGIRLISYQASGPRRKAESGEVPLVGHVAGRVLWHRALIHGRLLPGWRHE